jgi:hypothetical protein
MNDLGNDTLIGNDALINKLAEDSTFALWQNYCDKKMQLEDALSEIETLQMQVANLQADNIRMDFVEIHCLLPLDSESKMVGGNGQYMVAADRDNVDAAFLKYKNISVEQSTN